MRICSKEVYKNRVSTTGLVQFTWNLAFTCQINATQSFSKILILISNLCRWLHHGLDDMEITDLLDSTFEKYPNVLHSYMSCGRDSEIDFYSLYFNHI